MQPSWSDGPVTVYAGDCRDVMAAMEECSVDAVVTDPPYDLTANKKGGSGAASLNVAHPAGRSRITTGGGFMGREWDATGVAFDPATWRAVLHILKPGGHVLAFGGTRTYHRMACAIEDAGFEIRDSLHWIYGSGFPKSLDVSKAIDKAAGERREVTGYRGGGSAGSAGGILNINGRDMLHGSARDSRIIDVTAPATEDAARWSGWGSALKPAHEPIVMARKPLTGTLAANVLAHGTGAVNVDGCRVPHGADVDTARMQNQRASTSGMRGIGDGGYKSDHVQPLYADAGRWPPNILLTHSADCNGSCAPGCPVAEMDAQSGTLRARGNVNPSNAGVGMFHNRAVTDDSGPGDAGGASRFFPCFRYEAKAPARERPRLDDGTAWPTVKPLALMRWLVRLVAPPGGTVLDPFGGTGTTGEACALEGFRCALIERDPVALELAEQRLHKPVAQTLFG